MAKFTEKHLPQSLFFCLSPETLLKKWLWHRCFLVNFAKFLRTTFFRNNVFIEHFWCLLLTQTRNQSVTYIVSLLWIIDRQIRISSITAGRQVISLLYKGIVIKNEEDLQIIKDALKEIGRKDLVKKIQRHFATGKSYFNTKAWRKNFLEIKIW